MLIALLKAIGLTLCFFLFQPHVAIGSEEIDKKSIYNICFFDENVQRDMTGFTSYTEIEDYYSGDIFQDFEADGTGAALRTIIFLEAHITPIVTFAYKGAPNTSNMALITSESGAEKDDEIPGLTATMLFDEDFVRKINSKFSPEKQHAFLIVQLHEIAHYRMMRYFSHFEYARVRPILRELHADFMAGWFASYIQHHHYKDEVDLKNLGANMFRSFGSRGKLIKSASHGTGKHRQNSFLAGFQYYRAQIREPDEIDGLYEFLDSAANINDWSKFANPFNTFSGRFARVDKPKTTAAHAAMLLMVEAESIDIFMPKSVDLPDGYSKSKLTFLVEQFVGPKFFGILTQLVEKAPAVAVMAKFFRPKIEDLRHDGDSFFSIVSIAKEIR